MVDCCNPVVLFNRSLVPWIINNGYVVNGRHRHVPRYNDFDYARFTPVHFGAVVRSGKRTLINHTLIENSWVDTKYGRQPLFIYGRCGRCELCRSRRLREWSSRVSLESQCHSYPPLFVTFTYDEAHCPSDGVSISEMQAFIKRLRVNSGRSFRYLLCGEYGSKTHRPHYHALIFGFIQRSTPGEYLFAHQQMCRAWSDDLRSDSSRVNKRAGLCLYGSQKGNVYTKSVDPSSMSSMSNYVTKYMLKDGVTPAGCNAPFQSSSLGFGKSFVLSHARDIVNWIMSDSRELFQYCCRFTGELRKIVFTSTMLDYICPSMSRCIASDVRYFLGSHSLTATLRGLSQDVCDADRGFLEYIAKWFNRLRPVFSVLFPVQKCKYTRSGPLSDRSLSHADVLYLHCALRTLDDIVCYGLDGVVASDGLRRRYAEKCASLSRNFTDIEINSRVQQVNQMMSNLLNSELL